MATIVECFDSDQNGQRSFHYYANGTIIWSVGVRIFTKVSSDGYFAHNLFVVGFGKIILKNMLKILKNYENLLRIWKRL